MNRDFLKSLGVQDDAINQIMAQNGKDIESVKAQSSEELANLRKLNMDLTTKVEGLKDYDELKGYKDKFTELESKFNSETNALKISNAIDKALLSANVRNLDIVKNIIKTDSVKYDEQGNITGLTEQINALKENEAYLFKSDEPNTPDASDVGLGLRSKPIDNDGVLNAVFSKDPTLAELLK